MRKQIKIFSSLIAATIFVALTAPLHSASPSETKIPVTTKSEDARKEYLLGRSFSDRLQAAESLPHFDRAIALDADFAYAELGRAGNSPTPREIAEHLKRAVALADKVSEGERLTILATSAGANGDPVKQGQYWKQLVEAYPNDERAHMSLALYYTAQQDVDSAIVHYKKAAELEPNYSLVYNQLGYAYRSLDDNANAELSYKKYIEVLPDDPNPYDSYAELLLKLGRWDDSIANYRKALALNEHFAGSRFGISAALMYSGKPHQAVAEVQQAIARSRNDGEMRGALLSLAIIATDAGNYNEASRQLDKEFAIALKKNDVTSMAADLRNKGNILVEQGKFAAGKEQFDRALALIASSNQSEKVKENARLLHEYDLAGVSLAMNDVAEAKTHADTFQNGAATPAQKQLAHELAGRLALQQKDYDSAITELKQSSMQDPQNFYRLYLAYSGKGDSATAREYCAKAAHYNSLPQLNYAFVRTKAAKALTKSS